MLKATGIIRRIDELGRIVVPKELRNSLKIKDGTSMEIFTNDESELVLKKYNPMGNINDFADNLAESIRRVYPVTVLITDKDSIISSAGRGCEDTDKTVTMQLYTLMEMRRQSHITKDISIYLKCKREIKEMLMSPIIVEGDLYGSVIFLTFDNETITTQIVKVADMAVNLLQGQY
ncbi:MAG: stage V sporulation T C-terminal domain-containing protein [Clostridia bacterium]